MRFRSSTNAEDLGNFTAPGSTTATRGLGPTGEDIEKAIKKTWASVWFAGRGGARVLGHLPHRRGHGQLLNPTYRDEQANGVAIMGNIFDTSAWSRLYINAQIDEYSVVKPDAGVTTDQILYYYSMPGQPVVYIRRSNLIPDGETVLSNAQLYELGTALDAIHRHFYPVYGAGASFYAMDTEFKVTADGVLEIKQARPYPGWNVGVD